MVSQRVVRCMFREFVTEKRRREKGGKIAGSYLSSQSVTFAIKNA